MSIKVLEKSELGSIVFIRDYLQFVFEGDQFYFRLSSLIGTSTIVSKIEYHIHTAGWRDALCSLINKVVKKTEEEDRVSLKIIFEDDDMLVISLKEEDFNLKGNEAALLSYGEELVIWHSS